MQDKDKDSFDQNRVTFHVSEQVLIHLDLLFLIDCRFNDVPNFPIPVVNMYPAVDLYSYICLLPTTFKRLCGVVRSP